MISHRITIESIDENNISTALSIWQVPPGESIQITENRDVKVVFQDEVKTLVPGSPITLTISAVVES